MSFWCKMGFHLWVVVGWTIMGNPLEQCSKCGLKAVTYGSINPDRMEILEGDFEELNTGKW